MADSEIQMKNINELDENSSTNNADNFMVGEAGTNKLKRLKMSVLLDAIKNLITSWTFSALNTSSKVLTGAINEVYSTLNTLSTRVGNRGTYTGNIDGLQGQSYAGGYWCHSTDTTGTQPFGTENAWYFLEVSYANMGCVQRAVRYNTGEAKWRVYANDKWYDWTEDYATATELAEKVSASDFEIDTFTITGVTCDAGSSVALDFDATKSGYKLLAAWFRGASECRLLCVDIRVRTSTSHIEVVMHVLGQSSSVTDRCEVSMQALFVKE